MNKLIFCLGLCFCLFPLVSRGVEQKRQETVISTYEENIRNLEQSRLTDSIGEAERYNERMYQTDGLLLGTEGMENGQEEYENQLNVSGNGIMGSIQIPKINVNLPIYHGTEDEVLSVGVGHLPESSLPVGGIDTHSVLTGHRGLPNSQLFTRLDEMEEGDLFFIHIYNRTLAYRVCGVQVILPEERDLLDIEQGADKVSLITCTPYGINTHRLVVTGRRTSYEKKDYTEAKAARMSWRELLFTALPFLFIGIAAVGQIRQRRSRRVKRRRKKGRKRNAKHIGALFLLLCMCSVPVSAAEQEEHIGKIEIELTDGGHGTSKEQVKFAYAKVGKLEDGVPVLLEAYKDSGVDLENAVYAKDLEQAAQQLQKHVKNKSLIATDADGKAEINGLEEGIYLLELFDKAQYENVMPMLLTIPMWDETEEKMNYEIHVVPKHGESPKTPETGDVSDIFQNAEWLLLSAAAVLLVKKG